MIKTMDEAEKTIGFYTEMDNCESFGRSMVMRKLIAIVMVVSFVLTGDVSVTQAA